MRSAETKKRPGRRGAMPTSPSHSARANFSRSFVSSRRRNRVRGPDMHRPPLLLVADDNEANRDIFKTRLVAAGYEVVEAADGEEAMQVALAKRPDLFRLDMIMPKLAGFEGCRALKADRRLPYMPIIMITAKSETDDIVTGLDAGA